MLACQSVNQVSVWAHICLSHVRLSPPGKAVRVFLSLAAFLDVCCCRLTHDIILIWAITCVLTLPPLPPQTLSPSVGPALPTDALILWDGGRLAQGHQDGALRGEFSTGWLHVHAATRPHQHRVSKDNNLQSTTYWNPGVIDSKFWETTELQGRLKTCLLWRVNNWVHNQIYKN